MRGRRHVARRPIDSRASAQSTTPKRRRCRRSPSSRVKRPRRQNPRRRRRGKAKQPAPIATAPPAPLRRQPAARPRRHGVPASRAGSLVSPNTAEARAEIDRTPGGVELVPDTAYKASTPAATIKDALDYVPGVFAQPKWGDDTRLSIRGSGLSRNFHLRGAAALHGRHPDQHRRRLRRLPGDRSRPPTATSRSTRAPMRCASAPTRSAAPSIS